MSRSEIRDLIRQFIFNALEFTKYTLSSKLGDADKVAGHEKADRDDEEYDLDARRMQHFGFRSRPPKGTQCIRISVGGGATNSAIIAEDPGDRYGPGDLEDGETALYNTKVPKALHVTKDGDTAINSKDGQLVKLQGGGKGLVLKDMRADAGKLVFAFVPGPTATLSITYTDPDGIPTVLGAGSGNISLKVKLTEGSNKIEGA